MAEPTLIQTFEEIRLDVAEELGFGRTESKWTAEKTLQVNRMVNAGYRRFLFSAMLPGEKVPHTWDFLEPLAEITVWPTVTATMSGVPVYDASKYSTITVTADSFFPTMVGKEITFTDSGNSYTISSYSTTKVIVVLGDASGELSGDTVTITANGDYRLPDDFGGVKGSFHILGNTTVIINVEKVGVGIILNKRANLTTYDYTPQYFAIKPVAIDGSSGQRHDLMLYPTPNETLVMQYQYSILPNVLDSTYPYPKGAEQFSEAITYACLAEVERRQRIDRGFREEYERLVAIAIQRDRLDALPDNLGYNGDVSINGKRRYYDRTVGADITFNGTPI